MYSPLTIPTWLTLTRTENQVDGKGPAFGHRKTLVVIGVKSSGCQLDCRAATMGGTYSKRSKNLFRNQTPLSVSRGIQRPFLPFDFNPIL